MELIFKQILLMHLYTVSPSDKCIIVHLYSAVIAWKVKILTLHTNDIINHRAVGNMGWTSLIVAK